jgi:hypothetical protein
MAAKYGSLGLEKTELKKNDICLRVKPNVGITKRQKDKKNV